MGMAGEIVKRVRTEFVTDVDKSLRNTKRLEIRMKKLGMTADRVAGKIGGLARAVLAPIGLIGVGAGVGLVKTLFDAGKAAEDAELQIAGLLQGVSRSSNLKLTGFTDAMGAAKDLREEFIKLAQDSPISAREVRGAFEIAVFPLTRAGLSLQEQAEFARGIAVADISNVVKGTAAADVRQLFQGIANPRMIQTGLLKPIAKAVASAAKKGDLQLAAKLIAEQLRPDPEWLRAAGEQSTGLLATLADRWRKFKQEAAKPLMEFVVGKVKELLDWLEKNQELVKRIATEVGTKLVSGLKAVGGAARWLFDHWDDILRVVKWLAITWIGSKLVKGMTTLIALSRAYKLNMLAAGKAGAGAGGVGAKAAQAGGLVGLAAAGGAAAADVVKSVLPEEGAGGFISEVIQSGLQFGGIGLLAKAIQGPKEITRLRALHSRIDAMKGLSPQQKRETMWRAVSGEVKTTEKQKTDFTKSLSASIAATKVEKKEEKTAEIVEEAIRRGGGRGGMRVKRMVVEEVEVRERDFARLSTPLLIQARRESRAERQLVGMGLGSAAIGVL